MVPCHGDAVSHEEFVPGAAKAHQIDPGRTPIFCKPVQIFILGGLTTLVWGGAIIMMIWAAMSG